ncbi:hypothetical protein BD410DRAFT_829283 [Rickenella mellea]|uniref:Ricin B lectin domain-containing protein n=1 Tax=Rickenella mellea TaxID=50990 RepID=A0A4Y7Q106_9AGAM|nr:hypothetical protein BD410DRAFT_829283 [Rickenella mellea]
MFIEPGAYTIQNVMNGNFALQSGERKIVAHAERDSISGSGHASSGFWKLWSISHLVNDKYTIRNIENDYYAASSNFPAIGENIFTTKELHQWDIKETGVKGRYVICTTASGTEQFWGLADGWLDTPISLQAKPNTTSNQWKLNKAESWTVACALRAERAYLQNEYAKIWHEHTELQNEHTRLRHKHTKLRDKHTKLCNIFELLDGDAVETFRKERALAEDLKAGLNLRRMRRRQNTHGPRLNLKHPPKIRSQSGFVKLKI